MANITLVQHIIKGLKVDIVVNNVRETRDGYTYKGNYQLMLTIRPRFSFLPVDVFSKRDSRLTPNRVNTQLPFRANRLNPFEIEFIP